MGSEPNPPCDVVRSRILPRDALDVAIGLPFGLLAATVVMGLPAVSAYLVSDSVEGALVVALLAGGISLLYTVRSIELGPDGIRFRRLLGSPRMLTWIDVDAIVPVERMEVVLRGWLWPMFSPRDASLCLSARGHFRITWGRRWCYYAPKDPSRFQELVQKYLQGAV